VGGAIVPPSREESPAPESYIAGMSNTVVRIIKHEESFEVRVSTFFYFDDNPGRRSIRINRMKPEEAEAAAKAYAKVQRGDKPSPPKPDHEWETL
jgi:hypothetical protein